MRSAVLLLANVITIAFSAPTSTAVGASTSDHRNSPPPSTVTRHVTSATPSTSTTSIPQPHIDPPQDWEKELSRQRQAYPTLPTSIDICADPTTQDGSCIDGVARRAGTCLNIHGKGRPNNPDLDNSFDGTLLHGGICAVVFRGSTFCWLFDSDDCFGNRIVVKEYESDDLRDTNWDDKVRSLACWRKD